MYRAIFSILGFETVNLCDYRDGERFIEIISGAQLIEKIERASADPFTFDEKPSAKRRITPSILFPNCKINILLCQAIF